MFYIFKPTWSSNTRLCKLNHFIIIINPKGSDRHLQAELNQWSYVFCSFSLLACLLVLWQLSALQSYMHLRFLSFSYYKLVMNFSKVAVFHKSLKFLPCSLVDSLVDVALKDLLCDVRQYKDGGYSTRGILETEETKVHLWSEIFSSEELLEYYQCHLLCNDHLDVYDGY